MTTDPDQLRRDLQAAGRYMLANELAWGNAGNLSARLGADRLLVSASGTHLGNLAPDDLVECPLAPEPAWQPARKPSKEMPMHRAVYQARPEIQAVLHASPFYSTLVACSPLDLPANLFVEDMYYMERLARVPYFHPGSAALGEAVGAQARAANILLLENHGVLVYDTSLPEALMALHTLEFVSRMVLSARQADLDLHGLPPATVHDFLERSGYRPRRAWLP
jgi:3-dehydro-4-phosphotetronate decarboxylase